MALEKPPLRNSARKQRGYVETDWGWVVPPAYDDDYGGREGLTSETRLPPPIDDPSAVDLNTNEPLNLVNSNGEPKKEEEKVSRSKKKLKAKKKTSKEKDENLLDKILESPDLIEELKERLNLKQEKEGEFVTVYLVGKFGKFKTRPSEVFICPNHIALLYTKEAGDDDLLFEPPSDELFTIQIPIESGEYKTVLAKHFGFSTRIPNVGILVVMPAMPQEYNENEVEL